MKAEWIDFIVVGLYVAGLIAVSWYTRKKSKSVNDFLLTDKGVGGVMAAFAYGVTYFSAVIFIGYAGKNGYVFGLSSLWIGIGNAIFGSLLAWLVLGKRTHRMTRFYGARTMPELFEKRYGSKHLKLISALIIFVFLVPYAASVYQGLGALFELFFGIDFWVVVLIMAALTAVYLFFGGYLATVLTDFFQGIIMVFGVVVMVGFVVNAEAVGGITEGIGKLFSDGQGFFPAFATDSGAPLGYTLLMLILLTSFGVWGMPQMVHKFHTVRNETAIKQATYVSTGIALVIGVCAYFVGCFARYILSPEEVLHLISTQQEDQIIPMVLNETLVPGLFGLIAILVMSASMSTLASLTLIGSSAVSVDLYKGYIKKDAPEKNVKLLMRILCVVFVGISVVIAVFKPTGIVELMSLSWGTIAGCFLAPYIYGLYSKKATKQSAYASIITGISITALLYVTSLLLPAAIRAWMSPPAIGVAAMVVSMIVTPIVSHFTKSPQGVRVTELFDEFKKNTAELEARAPHPEQSVAEEPSDAV